MFDFKDSLSLDKINSYISMHNCNIEKIAEPYLLDIYFRILEVAAFRDKIEEMLKIQSEYFKDKLIFSKSTYDEEKNEFEKSILKNLRQGSDFSLNDKNDQYVLVNYLIQEYQRCLKEEISNYDKEELLIIIYSIASILSYISVTSTYLFKLNANDCEKSEKFIGLANFIVDSIGVVYHDEHLWTQNLLGTQKRSCEYLLSYLLNFEYNSTNVNKRSFDIKKVFIIAESILEKLAIAKSLELISKTNYSLHVSDYNLQIDSELSGKIAEYTLSTKNDLIDTSSDNANELIMEFEKRMGYSPDIISDYVVAFGNKHLNCEASMNTVEDKFLYYDMVNSTGYDYDAIYGALSSLTLQQSANIDKCIFSTYNRVFRTPIIKVDNYFILSNQLLMEASHYLRYRILKAEILNKGQFKKNVKKNYDEFELGLLEELISKYDVIGGINLDLSKVKKLQESIRPKGISKEIDFYFVLNKTMYTAEYKNQRIDNSLYEISQSYSRNLGLKSKHMRLINILRENTDILEDLLGVKIERIKPFMVFKNKNSFEAIYEGNDIEICSYNDFHQFCLEILDKYSQDRKM